MQLQTRISARTRGYQTFRSVDKQSTRGQYVQVRGPPSSNIGQVASAITRLFHPHVEVVMHDVAAGRIMQLWNPISGRRPGDESLIEPGFQALQTGGVIGPYQQIGIGGSKTTSVSVPVDRGRYLLCINFDRAALDGAIGVLASLAAAQVEQPSELFARDWRVRINASIADWCAASNLVARDLRKTERTKLIAHLEREGVFETRKAADHVALALGISRATVYNLRKEISR